MNILKIDGVEMPAPSDYSVSSFDITEAGRNAKGDMQIDYIATKQKLEVSWVLLTNAQKESIVNAIKSPQHITMQVNFISVSGGLNASMTCYKGDITSGVLKINSDDTYWKDFKVNFIEM